MGKNIFLIGVRYLSLVCLLTSLFMVNLNIPVILILILLLILINNQIRFFSFEKETYIFISLLLEIIILAAVQYFYGGIIAFYFIPAILDGILLLNKIRSYLTMIIIYVISISLLTLNFDLSQFSVFISFTMITGLCYYIKVEQNKKLDAQLLYDELRISQNKLKKANEELELYATSISELAVLKERNRISREIHDSVGHALSTAMIQLSAMERIAEKEQSQLASIAKTLREFIKTSYHEVRRAVSELKPDEYADYQELYRIYELVENFKKLSGVDVRLNISKDKWILSPRHGLIIYRIIQESLSNALRHGKASQVYIFITFDDHLVSINIKDNGCGCDNIVKGVGLTSMTERIKEVDGTVDYNSYPNEGFALSVNIPRRNGSEFDVDNQSVNCG